METAIKLRSSSSVTFHWVKGHASLRGNERADYLAKTAASYIPTLAYNEIPINRRKQLLEDHYSKLCNEIYVKSANASLTKLYIPTISHRLSLSRWPNFLLTQFLTNRGSFRSYLYKINKARSPNCNCPAKAEQTASHLLLECSLWSKDRPSVLRSLPPHLVQQFHINTVSITNFLRSIILTLQEEAREN
jgi:hypothetical protein